MDVTIAKLFLDKLNECYGRDQVDLLLGRFVGDGTCSIEILMDQPFHRFKHEIMELSYDIAFRDSVKRINYMLWRLCSVKRTNVHGFLYCIEMLRDGGERLLSAYHKLKGFCGESFIGLPMLAEDYSLLQHYVMRIASLVDRRRENFLSDGHGGGILALERFASQSNIPWHVGFKPLLTEISSSELR